jgi:hypothetical protein
MFIISAFTFARSLLGVLCFASHATSEGQWGKALSALILVSETGMRVTAVLASLSLIGPLASDSRRSTLWSACLSVGLAVFAAVLLGSRLSLGESALAGQSNCCTPSSSSRGGFGWALVLCNLLWAAMCGVGLYRRDSGADNRRRRASEGVETQQPLIDITQWDR